MYRLFSRAVAIYYYRGSTVCMYTCKDLAAPAHVCTHNCYYYWVDTHATHTHTKHTHARARTHTRTHTHTISQCHTHTVRVSKLSSQYVSVPSESQYQYTKNKKWVGGFPPALIAYSPQLVQ